MSTHKRGWQVQMGDKLSFHQRSGGQRSRYSTAKIEEDVWRRALAI